MRGPTGGSILGDGPCGAAGLGGGPFVASSSGVAVLDPSTLSLTGWVRGSYAAAPWAGTASAGTSGAKTFQTSGTNPTAGTAVNGLTPAAFNGSTQYLIDIVSTMSAYISTTAYRVSLLINATSAAAPAGNIYDNPGILTEAGGEWGIVFNSNGVSCYHDSAGYKVASQACSTGAWHAVDVLYNGTTLTVSVDGVAGTPVTAGTLGAIGSAVRVGGNYSHAVKFTGSILEIATAQATLATTTAAQIKAYYNSRYGLSL